MNDLGSREVRPLVYFMSWALVSRSYEQLTVVDDMHDSMSWVENSRCFEQLKVVDDINYSRLWTKGFRSYV